ATSPRAIPKLTVHEKARPTGCHPHQARPNRNAGVIDSRNRVLESIILDQSSIIWAAPEYFTDSSAGEFS
ncbi:MAG TPA: hypothetical protein VFZ51_07130, partial [Woeseiaceae bacterium]